MMNLKHLSKLAAALMSSALLVAPAMAQELTGTLKKIKESGTITIGHRETSIPFSYLDDKQQPIGYSMDLCMAIVEEVKKTLNMPALAVKMNPVTSQTRIPLMANGTIDLECGSTTNTLKRQEQVDFAPTTFVTGTKLVVKKSSKIKSYKDLKGKTVVVTQGTTNERVIKALNDAENLGMKFLSAKDHGESFLLSNPAVPPPLRWTTFFSMAWLPSRRSRLTSPWWVTICPMTRTRSCTVAMTLTSHWR